MWGAPTSRADIACHFSIWGVGVRIATERTLIKLASLLPSRPIQLLVSLHPPKHHAPFPAVRSSSSGLRRSGWPYCLWHLSDWYVQLSPTFWGKVGRDSTICMVPGCNTVTVACYAAAGFTFGTIAAPLAPPAIVACNTALGTCSAACATVALLAPTP